MTKDTLILATSNPHKIDKLTWIFAPYFRHITPQSNAIDVDETENSFEGNACLKAITVSKMYKGYAVATDGGVLIPSLGSDWNALLTKRFLGKDNVTDTDRIDGLLSLMKDKKGADRAIEWREAIAIAHSGKLIFSTEVVGDEGLVQETYDPAQYKPGIWQCTLTCYPQFGGKNFFELSEEERQYAEISWHRLKEMVDWFLEPGKRLQK